MSSIHDFQVDAPDWRQSLQRNRSRTRYVIATFIVICLVVGLLIDLYIYASHYSNSSLSELLSMLATFQLFPTATVTTGLVSLVSLYITFTFNHKLMLLGADYREITAENTKTLEERIFYNIVEELRIAATLKFVPKVYIIEADYMNAFASGYSEKSAMIAITNGLLYKLNRSELEAVIAHELSHIRHMDIKLTLTASVLANILLIAVDILFLSAIYRGQSGGRSRENQGERNQLFIFIVLLRYLMPLLTVILMLYLSRTREYMADAGSVELMRDNEPLARALIKIQGDHVKNREVYAQKYAETAHENIRHAAYIFNPITVGIQSRQSLGDFFSTHPSLVKRLAAIGYKLKKQAAR